MGSTFLIALLAAAVLLFQNCSGKFQAASLSSISTTATSNWGMDALGVLIQSPESSSYVRDTVVIQGSCAKGIPVMVSGDIENPSSVMCQASQFQASVQVTSSDGIKNIRVQQTDTLGNTVVDSRSFRRDTTPPVVLLMTPAQQADVAASVIIQGNCEKGLPVKISENSMIYELSCSSGTFSTTLPLSSQDGTVNVDIFQMDAASNTGSLTLHLKKDTVAPVVKILAPQKNQIFSGRVTLQGECESGLDLSVSGNLKVMSPPVCSDGKFSASVELSGAEGPKKIVVSQTDAAANKGTAEQTVLLDQSSPSLLITSPMANTVAPQGVTVAGNCESGINVQISGSGVNAPSSVDCTQGKFSAPISFSAGEGAKVVTASQTDSGGNTATDSRSFVKDSVAPTLSIQSPGINALFAQKLTIQGSCENGLPVQISGDVSAGQVSCAGSAFSASVTLSSGDGSKTITVSQTDAAGNSSTSSRKFIKDSMAPVVKILSPNAGVNVGASAEISGSCETGLDVTLGGSGLSSSLSTPCKAQTFKAVVVFTVGSESKMVEAFQVDGAGNKGINSRSFNRVFMGPQVTITSPAENAVFKNNLTVSGICQSGLSVVFSGSGWMSPSSTSCDNGSFSAVIEFTAGDGSKNLIASQTNTSQETGSGSRSFLRDTTAPAIAITSPAAGTLAQTGIRLQGSCETGLNVSVSGSGVANASLLSCTGGNFDGQVTLSNGDGDKSIIVSQADAAGNKGSASRDFVKSTTAPAIAITSPAANSFSRGSITLKGTCKSGLDVSIAGTGVAQSLSQACNNGSFSVAVTLSSGDGPKAVTVSQTDSVGNKGSDTRSFVRDTVAPAIVISSPAANSFVKGAVTLAGDCETGLPISVSGNINAGTAICSNGSFSMSLNFSGADGNKTISVSQTDAAGNSHTDSRSFVLDQVVPALSITSPAANTATKSTIPLAGGCESGLDVEISGQGLTTSRVTCAYGAYSFTVTLPARDGSKTITVSQTDGAGNKAVQNRSFILDTVAPVVTFTSPDANTTGETGLTLSGNCESGIQVLIAGAGVSASSNASCSSGKFSQDIVFSAGDGTKTITISQTDKAGNKGSASRHFNRVTPPLQLDGVQLYAQNCSACHGAIETSAKKGRSAAQITNAIATISYMSPLSSLSSAQISAIADALNGVTSEPPPLAVSDPKLTLGNRLYLESLYNEVFVAKTGTNNDDVKIKNITNTLLKRQVAANGGPCLAYDSSCSGAQQAVTPYGSGFADGNTMRKGYTTLACEQILEIDKSVTNVLANAGISSSSSVTSATAQTLFGLFNPGKAAPTEVLDALVNVAEAAKAKGQSTLDQWRFTILPLCLSSTMDIL